MYYMDDNPTDASFWEPLGGYVEVTHRKLKCIMPATLT